MLTSRRAEAIETCGLIRPLGIAEIERVATEGVGFGGPVDWRSGRICCFHYVDGWDNVEPRSRLVKLMGAPVAVENDSNLAALAEARHGVGGLLGFYGTIMKNLTHLQAGCQGGLLHRKPTE